MKSRFILYRRKLGGMFYVEDTQTQKNRKAWARRFAPRPLPCSTPAMNPPGNRN